jgi:UDP-N-acetylmuramyl pentapeptide phosphotransferase/UDP-N-acetylglucosamine-1-phosphate transferase
MFAIPDTYPALSGIAPVFWAYLLTSALATITVALAIIANRRPLSRLIRERNDAQAVQSSHFGKPMRLGGIAIFAGLGAGLLVAGWDRPTMPALLVLSAAPAFLAGLWEDLGYEASPFRRLIASFLAAVVAVVLLDTWVGRANMPGFDQVLRVASIGILLTVIVSAGFCHATNLVDGMNGLAAVVITTAATGLAILAHGAGQADIAMMAAILAAAMVGFFMLNWPFGTLFMGDAGSYGVGHILIWLAFLLADRESEIAVPALLLVLFWPFADTLHSIARRLVDRAPVFAPDRMHLHQKMRRCIEIAFLGGAHRKRSNPLATVALAPFVMMPVFVGVGLSADPRAAWAALAGFGTLFGLTHVGIKHLAIRRRRKYRCGRPVPVRETGEVEAAGE